MGFSLKDQELVFIDNQAVTATGSSDYKDIFERTGSYSLYGQDKALALVLTIHETAETGGAGTDTQTYNFKLVMADDAAGTNATNVINQDIAAASLVAGATFAYPLPKLTTWRRWWKVVHTLAGLDPGVTYSASIDAVDSVAHYVQYPSEVGN